MNKNNINLFNKILFFGLIVVVALSSVFPFLNWMTSWLALVLGIAFAILLGNPYEGKTGNITNNTYAHGDRNAIFSNSRPIIIPLKKYNNYLKNISLK